MAGGGGSIRAGYCITDQVGLRKVDSKKIGIKDLRNCSYIRKDEVGGEDDDGRDCIFLYVNMCLGV